MFQDMSSHQLTFTFDSGLIDGGYACGKCWDNFRIKLNNVHSELNDQQATIKVK